MIKSKADLVAEIAALPNPIPPASLTTLLTDMIDSYEDIIQEYTTVQRDLLTPFEGLKIYNTTSRRMEVYGNSMWLPCSQKETVAIDCSGNPNYPEALVGDQYVVMASGYIGGGSGVRVYDGDLIYCIYPNGGGDYASVGANWKVASNLGRAELTPIPYWIGVFLGTHSGPGFSIAATSNEFDIYTIPPKCIIHDCKIIPNTAFAGGSLSSYKLSVGVSGNAEKYCSARDLFTGFSINDAQTPKSAIESITSPTTIKATATSIGGNLNDATSGQVTIYLLLSILPD